MSSIRAPVCSVPTCPHPALPPGVSSALPLRPTPRAHTPAYHIPPAKWHQYSSHQLLYITCPGFLHLCSPCCQRFDPYTHLATQHNWYMRMKAPAPPPSANQGLSDTTMSNSSAFHRHTPKYTLLASTCLHITPHHRLSPPQQTQLLGEPRRVLLHHQRWQQGLLQVPLPSVP